MTTLSTTHSDVIHSNPIDLIEDLANENDWATERCGDHEVTMFIPGQYTDLQFRVVWKEEYRTLQFACLFDMRVPEIRHTDLYHTIGLINERMWIGHFEFWADEEVLLFRHASLSTDTMHSSVGEEHLTTMLETALGECDRFYPVFQFVMWGGKSPEQAIEAAMLDCVGTA